jgi:cytochrome c biogenesis protein CcdA
VAVAAVVGLAFDVGLGGLRLPTNHRQVNERWLDRYRGVVYGFGFGAQLGFGLATIVTGSIIYVMIVAAAASGSVAGGALIGVVFGLVRALPQLGTRDATTPANLRDVIRRSQRLVEPVRTASLVLQGLVAAAAIVLVVG